MNKLSIGRALAALALALVGLPVALSAMPAAQGAAVPAYTITDLGTLGGDESVATAINNVGQVVGYSQTSPSSFSHAFVWEDGVISPLDDENAISSQALDINDAGQVVGEISFTRLESSAVLWDDGERVDLGTLGQTPVQAVANGINNAGQITGNSTTEDFFSPFHAFLWQNGNLEDLGTLGGRSSSGEAINQAGQIVGFALDENNNPHAALWENGTIIDLGTLGGSRSGANDINNKGQIVGGSELADETTNQAFVWQNGTMSGLAGLGGDRSFANAINETGQIVGFAETADGEWRAVLWQQNTIIDLNTLLPADSPWTLTVANDINDAGAIVGVGLLDGLERAFLLTPEQKPEPSPEPSPSDEPSPSNEPSPSDEPSRRLYFPWFSKQ
jgi:probable HAF family extracellular repeat protein